MSTAAPTSSWSCSKARRSASGLARRGPLAVGEALHLVRQIASALRAAHDHGVVHRDLKPENIFLARDPDVTGGVRAKLLDFGIAKLVGDRAITTGESVVLGTPPFMSPEQCRGEDAVEQRSDVYSLGCVLFTMVTGRPPFDAAGGALLAMHQIEPTPIPSRRVPGLPAVVDHLVLRCMAKRPAERFTAGELSRAVAGLLHTPWLLPGERTAAAPYAVALCDTTAATQPMDPVRPSLVQRVKRTAMVAEVTVLAMAICGMAWLAMVLLSRFVA